MSGMHHLAKRIAQLDAGLGDPLPDPDVDPELARFISVMELVTASGPTGNPAQLPRLSPEDSDAQVDRCGLLSRLEGRAPALVRGPLAAEQYWTAVAKLAHQAPGQPRLDQQSFVAIDALPCLPASTKPFAVGLYTSSGGIAPRGVWRAFLQLQGGSTMFPRPWHTWRARVSPAARVREVASAEDWATFVHAFPRRQGELLSPDWHAVAGRYDGVHMSLRAIAATQGIELVTSQGILAATYWDVESTLWLRWRLEDALLVEVVPTGVLPG